MHAPGSYNAQRGMHMSNVGQRGCQEYGDVMSNVGHTKGGRRARVSEASETIAL